MSGMFYGLEIARRGLTVSQQAITLTGHNISNANTEGYTRQRLVIESLYPNTKSRLSGVVSIGGGAEVTDIDQVRSEYIDRQLRDEYAALGQWNTRSEEMQYIESILNEISGSGSISTALASFYDSLSKLSTEPDSAEVRTNLQQNGIKLCDTLNYYYDQLVEAQNSYNDAMSVTVDKINSLLTSISSYNEEIYGYEMGGQNANELRDNRNLLLDELSRLVNISYSEAADGKFTVSVEGTDLVSHTDTTLLTATAGAGGFYSIYYEGTTTDFDYDGGQLQAYKDLRDGNTIDNIGIPYMLECLNTLARSLAQEFNTVHETGYTIPYSTGTYGTGASETGIRLFEVPAGGYTAITAGNISLSQEVLESVNNIAASGGPIDLSAADTHIGNNETALALYALASSKTLATVGNFEDYVKSFVVQIGIASAGAKETASTQATIVDNLETRKEAISGVSIDEEMINLISYQYAYSAASRVLTAIDEALDVLINRTGRVGL